MKKFVTMSGVLVLTMLCLTGCGGGYTFEERTEQMHTYMQEKYGVEFQVDWSSQAVTREYHSWNCSLKGNTDEEKKGEIEVNLWYEEEEEPFGDSYFSVLTQSVTEERVRTAFAAMEEMYKIDVAGSGVVDNKFTSVDQYDQFLEEKGNDMNLHAVKVVLLDQGSEEANVALVEKFIQQMKKANIGNVYCNIYCVAEAIYETVEASNVIELNEVYVYRKAGRLNDLE